MNKLLSIFTLMLLFCGALTAAQAAPFPYLIITASNDATNNQLLIYNSAGKLINSIPTKGQGGVSGNGGGIAKKNGLLAVVNANSQSVSLFRQRGDSFQLTQVIPTLSKPVSITFGHNHLYILGAKTVESHKINGDLVVEHPDGSARLLVADGSAAQVGALPNQLIISEKSNTLEVADLSDGALTGTIHPVQLPPPPNNDTPYGLVTQNDKAYITIAHSDKVGLVRNGKLIALVSSENQHAPCWLTITGPWLFCSNTPSKSISRYRVNEGTLALDEPIAAQIQGGPTDIDAEGPILAVLDSTDGTSHLSQFEIDKNGNLHLIHTINTVSGANGVVIVPLIHP